jgi:amidase
MALSVSRNRIFLRSPSPLEVTKAAMEEHMRIEGAEAEAMSRSFADLFEIISRLDQLPQARQVLRHLERDPGYVPNPDEDPFNAFARVCRVEGRATGPLAGLTFGAKDSIAVAGIPITNASSTLPFTPIADAVVIERLLDAGATLVGKLNMDDFSSGATGETSFFGPARNPLNASYSAGGSSGGSGSAVASGAVDFSLGVDQGGSARIPAACCGVVAIKGTHALVPSHGSAHLDHTLDYICPTAANTLLAARVLEVLAGPDWRDPNYGRESRAGEQYAVEALDPACLRIGVIRDAADTEVCAADVLERFSETRALLQNAGATVVEVDVPLWRHGWTIMAPILIHLAGSMIKADGYGYGHFGLIDVDRMHHAALVRTVEADQYPPLVKQWLVAERYLRERYFSVTYAKAHNLRLELRRQIEAALGPVDALFMPGLPATAPSLAGGIEDDADVVSKVPAYNYNTCPVSLSGHPALVLPNGVGEADLPTSVQLVGRYFAEAQLVGLARAIERLVPRTVGFAPPGTGLKEQ